MLLLPYLSEKKISKKIFKVSIGFAKSVSNPRLQFFTIFVTSEFGDDFVTMVVAMLFEENCL